MSQPSIAYNISQLVLPVQSASTSAKNSGIGIGQYEATVVVAVTVAGMTLLVELRGQELDDFAGMLADAAVAATRFEQPSLGTCQ